MDPVRGRGRTSNNGVWIADGVHVNYAVDNAVQALTATCL